MERGHKIKMSMYFSAWLDWGHGLNTLVNSFRRILEWVVFFLRYFVVFVVVIHVCFSTEKGMFRMTADCNPS